MALIGTMRYFLCILFPPAAVLTTGRLGAFILSIVLTLFFWVPGIVHAILVTNDYYAERRNRRLVRAVKKTGRFSF